MTSGCTAQACNLRDNYAELRAHGYEVIGVSVNDAKSHQMCIRDRPSELQQWHG